MSVLSFWKMSPRSSGAERVPRDRVYGDIAVTCPNLNFVRQRHDNGVSGGDIIGAPEIFCDVYCCWSALVAIMLAGGDGHQRRRRLPAHLHGLHHLALSKNGIFYYK